MSDENQALVVSLTAQIAEFERNFAQAASTSDRQFSAIERRAKEAGQRMENALTSAAASVKNSLIGIGAAFGVVLLPATLMRQLKDLADKVADIGFNAKKAGMDIASFQKLSYVAEENKISIEGLTHGMEALQMSAAEFIRTGEGPAKDAFKQLGFSAEDLKERLKDPAQALVQLIARIQQFDTTTQIKLTEKIFGGDQFMRFVNLSSESLQDMLEVAEHAALVLGQDNVDAATKLKSRASQSRRHHLGLCDAKNH